MEETYLTAMEDRHVPGLKEHFEGVFKHIGMLTHILKSTNMFSSAC
jgi:hypothetical protein